MLNRWIEGGLLDVLGREGVGCIAFSPLAQGVLTGKYLGGVPDGLAGQPERLAVGGPDFRRRRWRTSAALAEIAAVAGPDAGPARDCPGCCATRG